MDYIFIGLIGFGLGVLITVSLINIVLQIIDMREEK